jgi:hypothetical protein
MPSAVGLLLGGSACCVTGLFRCGRATGAASCANIPVLNHDVLLIWSRGCITSRTADASAHSSPDRSANDSTCHAACGGTGCGPSWVCDGDGRKQEGGSKSSVFHIDTHECFST